MHAVVRQFQHRDSEKVVEQVNAFLTEHSLNPGDFTIQFVQTIVQKMDGGMGNEIRKQTTAYLTCWARDLSK